MDSTLAGRPLWDSPTTIVASDRLDTELRELFIRMGNKTSETELTTEWGEEEFCEAAADEEGDTVFVEPAPISSAATIRPSTFGVWADQGPVNSKRIRALYASFLAAEEYSVGEFLPQVDLREYGEEINFRV